MNLHGILLGFSWIEKLLCSRLKLSVNYYIQLHLSLDLKTWYDWFHMLFSLFFFLAISIGSTTAEIFSLLSFITHSRFDRFAKTLEKCTRQRLRPAKQPFFRKQICEFTLEELYPTTYINILLTGSNNQFQILNQSDSFWRKKNPIKIKVLKLAVGSREQDINHYILFYNDHSSS